MFTFSVSVVFPVIKLRGFCTIQAPQFRQGENGLIVQYHSLSGGLQESVLLNIKLSHWCEVRGLVTVITNTHIYTWLVNMVITTLVTTPDPIYLPCRYLHNIILPKLYRYGSDWFRVFLIILIYEYFPWQKCNPVNISISISLYQSSYLWGPFTHFWLERIPLSVADHKIEIFKIFSTYFCFSW